MTTPRNDLFGYLTECDLNGPEYAYLGHFRQMRGLELGHNDVNPCANDADQMDKFIESMEAERSPTTISDKPGGA
jgi:hypothetical protein